MNQPLTPSPAPTMGLTTSELESSRVAFDARADRAASDEAFSRVVEEHADFAYNVAYRMLRNVADAEDAVQEAFISAYRAFHRFKGQSKVSTWLYRIVVNACLMKIRKEKSRSNYLTETGYNDDVIQDWGNDPEQAAINGGVAGGGGVGFGVALPGPTGPSGAERRSGAHHRGSGGGTEVVSGRLQVPSPPRPGAAAKAPGGVLGQELVAVDPRRAPAYIPPNARTSTKNPS